MMDGDGALNLGGKERDEFPAYDLSVIRQIRSEWVRLKNDELKRQQANVRR
jgi:hypothetical protein